MKNITITALFLLVFSSLSAQTWLDSIETYGREVYMPAEKYKWDWGQGTFLNALIHLYNEKTGAEKDKYLTYIKTAMDATYAVANGKHPNAVASGHGMAFLARVTHEEKYRKKALEIYADYLKTPRAANGGVSHRTETVEFWDDTVYMLSMFLLEMYRLTGDEKYIADFAAETKAHSDKLVDKKTGLWVHGWDADNEDYDDKCSVVGWANKETRRSSEIWGRANGWITMALADALNTIPRTSKHRRPLEKQFKNVLKSLPDLQNKTTGHWYQLLIYPNDKENFQESSCTAMFAYAMTMGIKIEILSKKTYQPIVDLAYQGLKKHSTTVVDGKYLVPSQVCGGTCIGGKEYYYKRKITTGTGFGIGSFIMLGIEYDKMKR